MVITKEEIRTLLNKLQNDNKCKFDLCYLNEKNPNPFEWKTVIEGVQGSIYENGFYMLKIIFSENYPEDPPSVYFLNKIFHPHIHSGGHVCICPDKKDILTVLDRVENMFLDYDNDLDHAYNEEPRILCQKNKEQFIKKAQEWVNAYAKLEDLDPLYDIYC